MALSRSLGRAVPVSLAMTAMVLAACDFVRDNEPIAPRADEPAVQVVVVAGSDRVYAVVDRDVGGAGVRSLALGRAGIDPSPFEPVPTSECGTAVGGVQGETLCLAAEVSPPIGEGESVTLSGSTTAGAAISGVTNVPERPDLDPGLGDTVRITTTEPLPLAEGRAELSWTSGPSGAASTVSVMDVRVERADGSHIAGCAPAVIPAEDALIEGDEVRLELGLPSVLCTDAATVSGSLVLASVDSAFAAFHRAVREGADRLPFGQFGIAGAHGVFGSMAPRRRELSWKIAPSFRRESREASCCLRGEEAPPPGLEPGTP